MRLQQFQLYVSGLLVVVHLHTATALATLLDQFHRIPWPKSDLLLVSHQQNAIALATLLVHRIPWPKSDLLRVVHQLTATALGILLELMSGLFLVVHQQTAKALATRLDQSRRNPWPKPATNQVLRAGALP